MTSSFLTECRLPSCLSLFLFAKTLKATSSKGRETAHKVTCSPSLHSFYFLTFSCWIFSLSTSAADHSFMELPRFISEPAIAFFFISRQHPPLSRAMNAYLNSPPHRADLDNRVLVIVMTGQSKHFAGVNDGPQPLMSEK